VAGYLVRRLLFLVPVVLGMTLVVFLMLHLSGGDPAIALAGDDASPEVLSVIRQRLGLDRPLHVRYLAWVGGLLRGDLGTSLIDGRPVLPTIARALPATMVLMAGAMVVAVGIGLPAGVLSALNRHSAIDHASRLFALAGVSIPGFWLGLILILLLAYHWPILPLAGYGTLRHLVLPSLTLGTAMAALLMRLTRASLLEVLREDYMRTAYAKGLSRGRAVFKHALRNGMLPIVTAIGLEIGILLGGTVIVESIFSWPGIGRLAYVRMLQRDAPMVMGNLLIYGVIFGVVNLLTDLSYALLDPRIRYE
jgi:peptide/nickel transport system permease protein